MGLENHRGSSCVNEDDIKTIAISNFKDIFTSGCPTHTDDIMGCVHWWVTSQHNDRLTQKVTSEEIWQAVKLLNPTKSPGPMDL